MNVGDRVSLTEDVSTTHTGTVTTRDESGMLTVKWDSGITERLHEEEVEPEDADAYEADDPKHPTFRERLSEWWDARK